MLMQRYDLDYAMAHHILGKAIRQSIKNGSDYLNFKVLNEAEASLNITCVITLKEFESVTDLYQIVASRQGEGNETIESVTRMIDGCQTKTKNF